MFEYIKNHAALLITFILIAVFFVFAIQQKSGGSTASAADFRQINMSSPMVKGDAAAPVSVIQYSDFLCPSCSYFSTQIMPSVDSQYVKDGKVKFEFRPMAFIAQGSMLAAEGAYCAVDQNKFWAYHDTIYNYVADAIFNKKLDPKSDIILTPDIIKQNSQLAGLDEKSFSSCLDAGGYSQKVIAATNQANANGVTSTPYILVNGQQYQGAISLQAFDTLIKTQL